MRPNQDCKSLQVSCRLSADDFSCTTLPVSSAVCHFINLFRRRNGPALRLLLINATSKLIDTKRALNTSLYSQCPASFKTSWTKFYRLLFQVLLHSHQTSPMRVNSKFPHCNCPAFCTFYNTNSRQLNPAQMIHIVEAIALRLEAIASRLEAITLRLEAMALNLGWRPSPVGWRPSLVGWRPSPVGWRPSLLGWRPLLLGAVLLFLFRIHISPLHESCVQDTHIAICITYPMSLQTGQSPTQKMPGMSVSDQKDHHPFSVLKMRAPFQIDAIPLISDSSWRPW